MQENQMFEEIQKADSAEHYLTVEGSVTVGDMVLAELTKV